MNRISIPFGLYDFLGYVFPGLVFFLASASAYFATNPDLFSKFVAPFIRPTDREAINFWANIWQGILTVFILLVVSYMLGHLTAVISSWFVRKLCLLAGKSEKPYDRYLQKIKYWSSCSDGFARRLKNYVDVAFGKLNKDESSRVFHLCWTTVKQEWPSDFSHSMYWWYISVMCRGFMISILPFGYAISWLYPPWGLLGFIPLAFAAMLFWASWRYGEYFTRDIFDSFYRHCSRRLLGLIF